MTEREFVDWLKTLFEICPTEESAAKNIELIRQKLSGVIQYTPMPYLPDPYPDPYPGRPIWTDEPWYPIGHFLATD